MRLLALQLLDLVPAGAAVEDVLRVDEGLGSAGGPAAAHAVAAGEVGAAEVEGVDVRGEDGGEEEEAVVALAHDLLFCGRVWGVEQLVALGGDERRGGGASPLAGGGDRFDTLTRLLTCPCRSLLGR